MGAQSPAHLFKNLEFDQITMETKLAEVFLKKTDTKTKFQEANYYSITFELPIEQNHQKIYRTVAQKIRESSELFVQLEAVGRHFNPDDVKKYDVPMIANQFEYFSSHQRTEDKSLKINFTSETPLAILGFLANAVDCIFFGNCDTAPVVILFGQLCQNAGFNVIEKYVREPIVDFSNNIIITKRMACLDGSLTDDTTAGSVVAVTSQTDVDSAIECVRHAPRDHRYPWHIRRVIVHESIYDNFRTRLSNKESDSFAFDFAGSERETTHILVEAYRTTKELLSLLEKYRPLYLSVWCNDISTSNEIAVKSSALTIWINDYGVVNTSAILPSFYTGRDLFRSSMLKLHHDNNTSSKSENILLKDIDNMVKARAGWLKKSVAQRKEVVLEVIDRVMDSDTLLWKDIRNVLLLWEPKTFSEVSDGRLTFGFQMPYGSYFVRTTELDSPQLEFFLKSVILGNGAIFTTAEHYHFSSTEFQKLGVPFVHSEVPSELTLTPEEKYDEVVMGLSYKYLIGTYVFKTITTRFGETFAN